MSDQNISSTNVEDVLQALANLQYIDSKLDEIERLRGDLPEEIADIETHLSRLESRVAKLEKEKEALSSEFAKLSIDAEEAAALVEKYDKQQMTVRNNREYDALTKEIEAQKQRIENAKSRKEEVRMLLSEHEVSLQKSAAELAEGQQDLEQKKAQLKNVLEHNKAEEAELLEKRDVLKVKVADRYLRSYERLRKGLNNSLAVVPMENGSCLGMLLPPQTQVEVRRKSRIVIDEHSGRIVIDRSFFEEARRIFG